MPLKITSLTNPKIKNIVRLRQRKHRDETGMTVIDGLKEAGCALKAGVKLTEVYICPDTFEGKTDGFQSAKAEMFETTKDVFDKMAYGDRNDGVLAVCVTPKQSAKIKAKAAGLYLAVEQIEKPGNLGAILRTADAAGVDGVFVCDPRTDLYNPNVIRASIGAVFSVPVTACDNDEAFEFFRKNKITVMAAVPQARHTLYGVGLKEATAVVLGSEEQGLSEFWIKNAAKKISVPMRGRVDSLNVSVTAAVILYEANRQRQN